MWFKTNLVFGCIAVFLVVILGTTEAGTVYKTIIKNGTGPVPQNNQTVVVHYTGKLQNGDRFDSSRDRNEAFKFKLGAGEVIRGWDAGVATMRVGERSELEIAPEDGYGAEGYPPVIPRSATLLFDIELLAIEGITPMPSQSSFGLVDVLSGGSSQSGFSANGGQFVPGTVFAADSGQLGPGNGFTAGGGQSGPGTGFDTTNVFDSQGFNSGSFGTASQSIDTARPGNTQGFGGMGTDINQGFAGMGSGNTQSFSSPSFTQPGSMLPSGATRSSGGGLSGGSSFGSGTSTQTAFGGSPTSSFDFSRSASTGRPDGSRMSLPDSFSAPTSGGGASGSLRNPFQPSMDGPFDFGSSGAGAALFSSQGGPTGSFSMGGTTGRSTSSSFREPSFDNSMTRSFEPSIDSRFGDIPGGNSAMSGRDFSRDRSAMNTGSRIPGMDMSIGSRDFSSGSMDFGRSSDSSRFDRFASAERGRSFSPSGSSGIMDGAGRMRSASDFLNMEFGGRGSSSIGTGGMASGMGIRMGSGFGATDSSAGRRDFGRGMRSDRFGGMTLDASSDRSRERPVGADRRTFRGDTGSGMGGRGTFRGDTGSGMGGRGTSGTGIPGGMGSMMPGMTGGMVPMGPQGTPFRGMSPGMRSSGFMPGMGSGMAPGMGTGMAPGMGAGMASGMRPGMASGMRPGMAPGMGAGMASGMRPGMAPGMGAGMASGMRPGMAPGMGPGMAPGMARMGAPGMGTMPGMMRPGMVPPFRRPRMSPFMRRGGRRRRRMMGF